MNDNKYESPYVSLNIEGEINKDKSQSSKINEANDFFTKYWNK